MDRDYWRSVVTLLSDPGRRPWAAHVLATGLPWASAKSNLRAAVDATSPRDVIAAVLLAYEDWSAQPNCDLMLKQFDVSEVVATYNGLTNPPENTIKGFCWLIEEIAPSALVGLRFRYIATA